MKAKFIESNEKLYVGCEIKSEADVFDAKLLMNTDQIEEEAKFIESNGKSYIGYEIKNEDHVFDAKLLINKEQIDEAIKNAHLGIEMTEEELKEACSKSFS